ncbi:MAG TPA: hypothetical protein VIG24_15505 [Acidimicrobiia bacterium]
MAFSSGTFQGSTDLLVKLNTFLTANGWTKLEGESDLVPASPKSARYWRVLVLETENTANDFRHILSLELRTTAGGANVATTGSNWSFSNDATGTGNLVPGGGGVDSSDIDDNWWWAQYDFGSGTIVREAVMSIDSGSVDDDHAPRNFLVQWSNDAKVWTTMVYYSDQLWTPGETKTFTWDAGGGFTDSYHVSATIARRSGWLRDAFEGSVRGVDTEGCDNYWSWQGPGYDANRRVYINAISFSNETAGTDAIQFDCATSYNASAARDHFMDLQEGSCLGERNEAAVLLVNATSGAYWFYANASRFVVVCRNGVDDYTSAYLGFLSAFAIPDDYPFPLYQGATNNSRFSELSDTNANLRDFADPGTNGAFVRLWDNTWEQLDNHSTDAGRVNDPFQAPHFYTWPFHTGSSARSVWPDNTIGDYVDYDAHWLDRIEPTDQGDVPLIPVLVFSKQWGAVGALDGVFAVPQAGVISPEQVLTISAVNYRVFRVRDKSGGMVYWAILEA